VGCHVVAALLNAASGRTVAPNKDAIQNIWSEYADKGYYSPVPGVKWDHAQICAYLLSTMPA